MSTDTVTIPSEEYDFLKKCAEVVGIEADKDLTPELIDELKKAEDDIKKAKGHRFNSASEVKEYLDSM